MTSRRKNGTIENGKGGVFLKQKLKNEIIAAVFAGILCGAMCLAGFIFIAPERWYLSFVVAVFLGGVVWYISSSDRKKNSGKFERDEHLIDFPYIYSAAGYLRGDSDRDAKFFFGEEKIGVLYYKNVRPLTEEFEKENIKVGYFDRCGWFTIVINGEKERIVIPKGNAEKAAEVLDVILGEKE